ncbi:glycosyltransferase, partial [Singulisphaera rosea]
PLRLVTCLGSASASLAAVLLVWVFLDAFRHHSAPRGWASTIVVVIFMGSVQLISLGIIGEYIRLIFLETKGRPPYLVREYRPASARTLSRVHSPTLRGPHRPSRANRTSRAPGFPTGPA